MCFFVLLTFKTVKIFGTHRQRDKWIRAGILTFSTWSPSSLSSSSSAGQKTSGQAAPSRPSIICATPNSFSFYSSDRTDFHLPDGAAICAASGRWFYVTFDVLSSIIDLSIVPFFLWLRFSHFLPAGVKTPRFFFKHYTVDWEIESRKNLLRRLLEKKSLKFLFLRRIKKILAKEILIYDFSTL